MRAHTQRHTHTPQVAPSPPAHFRCFVLLTIAFTSLLHCLLSCHDLQRQASYSSAGQPMAPRVLLQLDVVYCATTYCRHT